MRAGREEVVEAAGREGAQGCYFCKLRESIVVTSTCSPLMLLGSSDVLPWLPCAHVNIVGDAAAATTRTLP
jgi:hypothetical protein